MKNNKPAWFPVDILLVLIGSVLLFLAVYGVVPLDVQNDAWIMAGYDESDLIQHYAGWTVYRNSPWTFPIGKIADMAVGTGTMISFTDSIPLVAILCKAVNPVLPETFQYFGWYILVCFCLQGIAAYKIAARRFLIQRTPKLYAYVSCAFATILIGFTPILLERSFRHTALGSQWLLLFAIYVFLKGRDALLEGQNRLPMGYLLLNILSVLIHPYFLPMVMIFTLLTVVEYAWKKKSMILCGGYLLLNVTLSYAAGWLIGALGWGVDSSRFGYGYFSLNLNALANPSSLGGYRWSRLLPVLGQVGGNYDGFSYLGAGVLTLAVFVLLLGVIRMFKGKSAKWLLSYIRKNVWVLLVFTGLTCFAVTNVVTLNDRVLFEIPIPEWLYWKCGIFRASARMFYPVYECLIIFLVYRISEQKKKLATGILLFVTLLQLWDISPALMEKHRMMAGRKQYESVLSQQKLSDLSKGHTHLLGIDFWDITEFRATAVWAGKHHMSTSYSVANSGTYEAADQLVQEELSSLKEGRINNTYIYATQDLKTFGNWVKNLEPETYTTYDYHGVYYLIPNN